MVNFFENFREIFLHRPSGALEPHKRVRPDGAAPFLHRMSGALELPLAGSPLMGRLFFLHRLTGAHELPQACSPLTGGKFFAEPQRGAALCGAREVAAPRGGGKKEGTPAVSLPLWTPTFPLLDSLAKIRERRPLRKGVRQRIFSSVFFVTYSQGQIPYCYTCGLVYAGAA